MNPASTPRCGFLNIIILLMCFSEVYFATGDKEAAPTDTDLFVMVARQDGGWGGLEQYF